MERADYERLASSYDRVRGDPPFLDAWADRIAAALAVRRGDLVLDVGVGTGAYALRLAARGARVVGADPARSMVRRARAKGLPDLALADGRRLPFRDASVAGALAAFVLHHLPDWPRAVVEAARVVRPGGALAVVTRSHAELRASVMSAYPGVLDLDLARFPDTPALRAELERRFRHVEPHTLAKGTRDEPVEAWVARARGDFISTLSLLPPSDRDASLRTFERRLRERGPVVVDRSTFTLLVARDPRP